MHRTAVIRAMKVLRGLGVLVVERASRGWKATRYRFVADALPTQQPENRGMAAVADTLSTVGIDSINVDAIFSPDALELKK